MIHPISLNSVSGTSALRHVHPGALEKDASNRQKSTTAEQKHRVYQVLGVCRDSFVHGITRRVKR